MKDTDGTGCGKCTMCCKLMGVEEFSKPMGVKCVKLARNGGCSCYSERPKSCATYECLWLQATKTPKPWPIELKPVNCGVLFNPTDEGNLGAEVNTGIDWRVGYLANVIAEGSFGRLVVVRQENKIWVVSKGKVISHHVNQSDGPVTSIEIPDY